MEIILAAELNDSTWGVLVNSDKKIFVARRAKHINNPHKINLPGGGIDEGETSNQAILREIKEEVGIKEKDLSKITKVFINHNDRKTWFHIFNCTAKKVKLNAESSKYWWKSLKELKNISKNDLHYSLEALLNNKKIMRMLENM